MYAGRIVEQAPVGDAVRRAAASVHAGPAALDAATRRAGRCRAGADPRPLCRISGKIKNTYDFQLHFRA